MSDDLTVTDKRRFNRVPFAIEATLCEGEHCFACQVLDISMKGVLLKPPRADMFHPGREYQMRIPLDAADTSISMRLTVAHITGEQVGLTCREIDADSLIHLRRLLELNLGDATLVERDIANLGQLQPDPSPR